MKKKLSALLCLALTAVISLNACTRLFSQDENDAFLKFTADLFRQEVSSSAITLHYILKNMALKTPPSLWAPIQPIRRL